MSGRLVHVTCPDPASAQALARSLVDARLAACCSVLPGMTSMYRHELPEVVAVEIADGLAPYLAWLHAETRPTA